MSNVNETLIPKIAVVDQVREDTPDVKTFRVITAEGNKPFEHIQGFDTLIPGAVPNDGNSEVQTAESFGNHPRKVCRGNKLNVMYAAVPKLKHHRTQLLYTNDCTDALPADFSILTENTAKITTGKENGSGTATATDTGLFSIVWSCTNHARQTWTGTEAAQGGIPSQCMAMSGTVTAKNFHYPPPECTIAVMGKMTKKL